MSPDRIQLSRKKGYRKPAGAVVVARPSKWGNPYRIEPVRDEWHGPMFRVLWPDGTEVDWCHDLTEARRLAVVMYTFELPADVSALAGHDLACWCPLPAPGEPDICHGAVLLELAAGRANGAEQ